MFDRYPFLGYLTAFVVGFGLIATGAITAARREKSNPPVSRDSLDSACYDGEGKSCYALGLMWGNGEGGPKDAARAREYVRQGCEAGHDESCQFLPMMK